MQTVFHDLPTKLGVLGTGVFRAINVSSEDAAIFRSCRGFRTGPTSLFTVLLFPLLAILFSYFIRGTFVRYRLTLPYTVPLVLLGGVFGVAGCYLSLGELSQSLRQWVSLNDPTILYYILFPPILFESAMYLDWWVVKHTIPHQFSLSIILVFISAAIIAAFTTYVFGVSGWSFNAGWVFGALISPTDALAVALTLAQTPVRKHIQVMIQGEALFNDGSGFTLFIVFLSRLMPNPNLSIGYIFQQFFRLAGGGILLGVGMGIPTLMLLRLVWRDAAIEIGSTLVMSYLVFYVAEGPCGVSGIVAVSAFGVMFSADRIASITPAFQESLDAFWEAVSHIINSVAFVYAGFISVVNLIVFWGKSGVNAAAIGYGVALYPITYLCRVVAVIALFPILRSGRYGASWREAVLIVHCGLRGAISLIAAQIVFHTPSISGSTVVSARVQLWTSMVVLLTLLFQGTSVRQVAAWLGLLRETEAEVRSFRLQVRRLHRYAKEALWEMHRKSRFVHANWLFVEEAALLPYKLDELILSAGRVRSRTRQLAARYAKAETTPEPTTLTAEPSAQSAPNTRPSRGRQPSPPPEQQGSSLKTPQEALDDHLGGTKRRSSPEQAQAPPNDNAFSSDELLPLELTEMPVLDAIEPGFVDNAVPFNHDVASDEVFPSTDLPLSRYPLERKLSHSVLYARQLVECRRRTLLAVRANIQKQHLIGSVSRVTYRLLDSVIDQVNDQVCIQGHQKDIRLFESSQHSGWGLTRWERLGIKLFGRVRFLDRLALAILHRRLFIGYDLLSGLAVGLVQAWRSRYAEFTRALDSLRVLEKIEPKPRSATLLTVILHADAQVLHELERDLQRCEQHLRSMRILSLETVRSCESLRAAAVLLSRQERILETIYAEGLLTKREFRGLVDQIDMRREALQRVSVRFPPPSFEKSIEAGIRRWFLPSSTRGVSPPDNESSSSSSSSPGAARKLSDGPGQEAQALSLVATDRARRLYAALRGAGQIRSVLFGERLQASNQRAETIILVARGVLELRWSWARISPRGSASAADRTGPGCVTDAPASAHHHRQRDHRESLKSASAAPGRGLDQTAGATGWMRPASPAVDLESGTPVCPHAADSPPASLGVSANQAANRSVDMEIVQETAPTISPAADMPMTHVIARLISRDNRQAEAELASMDARLTAAAATFTGELANNQSSTTAIPAQPASGVAPTHMHIPARLWKYLKKKLLGRGQTRPRRDAPHTPSPSEMDWQENPENRQGSAHRHPSTSRMLNDGDVIKRSGGVRGTSATTTTDGPKNRAVSPQSETQVSSPVEGDAKDLVEWADESEMLDSEALAASQAPVPDDHVLSENADSSPRTLSQQETRVHLFETNRTETPVGAFQEYEVVSLLRHDDPLRNVHGIGGVLFDHAYPYELVVASEVASVLLIPRAAFEQIIATDADWHRECLRLAAAEVVDALIPGLETFFGELYRITAAAGQAERAIRDAVLRVPGSSEALDAGNQSATTTAQTRQQSRTETQPSLSASTRNTETRPPNAATSRLPPTALSSETSDSVGTPKLPPRQHSFTMYDNYQWSEHHERWWTDASRSTDMQAFMRYQVYVTGALAWYGLYERAYQITRGSFEDHQCLLRAAPSMIMVLLEGTLELRPTSALGAQILSDALLPGRSRQSHGDRSHRADVSSRTLGAAAHGWRRRWRSTPPDGIPPGKLTLLSGADIPSLMRFLNGVDTAPDDEEFVSSQHADGNAFVSGSEESPDDWRACSCRVTAPAVLRLDHLAICDPRPLEDIAIYASSNSRTTTTTTTVRSLNAQTHQDALAKRTVCYVWMDLTRPSLRNERRRLLQSARRLQAETAQTSEEHRSSGTNGPATRTMLIASALEPTRLRNASGAAETVSQDVVPIPNANSLSRTNTDSGEDPPRETGSRMIPWRTADLPPRTVSLLETSTNHSETASAASGTAVQPSGPSRRRRRLLLQHLPAGVAQQSTRLRRSRTELADILAAYRPERAAFRLDATVPTNSTTSDGSTRSSGSEITPNGFQGSTTTTSSFVAAPESDEEENQLERDADLMARQHFF
ncbi:hypothetical protein CCYA_CCYA15G3972 [Cyanidiococcus yangmingshanensis]|nr:hypothetical protein CCYA_CCYA15G3972 [Cyanidiococcus yangmingshanensis]